MIAALVALLWIVANAAVGGFLLDIGRDTGVCGQHDLILRHVAARVEYIEGELISARFVQFIDETTLEVMAPIRIVYAPNDHRNNPLYWRVIVRPPNINPVGRQSKGQAGRYGGLGRDIYCCCPVGSGQISTYIELARNIFSVLGLDYKLSSHTDGTDSLTNITKIERYSQMSAVAIENQWTSNSGALDIDIRALLVLHLRQLPLSGGSSCPCGIGLPIDGGHFSTELPNLQLGGVGLPLGLVRLPLGLIGEGSELIDSAVGLGGGSLHLEGRPNGDGGAYPGGKSAQPRENRNENVSRSKLLVKLAWFGVAAAAGFVCFLTAILGGVLWRLRWGWRLSAIGALAAIGLLVTVQGVFRLLS